jgi:DNA sulfur modification protein DndC
VEKDRSMAAMIDNDEEKEWMKPLLAFRDFIDFRLMGDRGDKDVRDFRRMSGKVQLFKGEPIHGPYKQSFREELLRQVLKAQIYVQQNGPEEVKDLNLITMDELKKIRDIWVGSKHEVEDSLPHIYEEATGKPFPDIQRFNLTGLGYPEMQILKDCCSGDEIHYQLIRELLHVERQHSTMTRRSGLNKAWESALAKGFYADEEDAKQRSLDYIAIDEKVEQKLQAIAG